MVFRGSKRARRGMEMPETRGDRVWLGVMGWKPFRLQRSAPGAMPEFFTAASLSSLLQAAFFTPATLQEWRHSWARFWKVNEDCCKNAPYCSKRGMLVCHTRSKETWRVDWPLHEAPCFLGNGGAIHCRAFLRLTATPDINRGQILIGNFLFLRCRSARIPGDQSQRTLRKVAS